MYRKEIRLAKGLSQEEFAKELGICSQCVSNWETGISKPSISSSKKLIAYCRANNIKYMEDI
jgi:DNA-binding transcriptional regulator YiaG